MKVALAGAELEENLGLRYMASALEHIGHQVEIIPFNSEHDISYVVNQVIAFAPQVTGLSMVFTSRARASAGDRPGESASKSAAEPATIGAAPEVPPKGVVTVPVPASAEIDAPGAPISGLMRLLKFIDGPREDEPTMVPMSGMPLAGSISIEKPVPATALRALLSAWLIM